jgi:integrase
MASVSVTRRKTRSGPRYVVRYRLGGRAYPLVHGGSFKTQKEARARRDYIAGELSAGRNPQEGLRAILDPKPKRTTAALFEEWKASRLDLVERTIENHEGRWKRLEPTFGSLAPDEHSHKIIQQWIADNAQGERALTPKVLREFVRTLAQVLDHAGVDPNPARDRRIRYPVAERAVIVPPSDKQVLAMLDHIPRERRLFYAFLEQDGGRSGEHIAFTWGDVDQEASKILARPEVVKGRGGRRRARWVQVPEWLMEQLLDTCPPEDRIGDRPLFPWLHTVNHPRQAAIKTMSSACKAAGIPHFHPHDLRHRRISLWHGQGIPARQIGERVGQQQIAVTLDTYTHVMPLDEISKEAYEAVLV